MVNIKLNSFLTAFLFLGTYILTGYCYDIITCICDSCQETNYTCLTTESCLTTLKRSFLEDEGVKERGCASFEVTIICDYPEEEDKYNRYVQHRCCYENFCNENVSIVFPVPATTSPPTIRGQNNDELTAGMKRKIAGGVCSFVVLMAFLIIYKCRRHTDTPETSALRAYDDSSGGSQLQYLGQSTIAGQISIVQLVGRGRFGQVYRAKWKNEDVAVKSFNSSQDGSWIREAELYQTVMLRHENILGFIASDTKDNGMYTQLWLITDYHKNGSLCDYLQRTTLNVPELLKLSHSAARGLAHLHSNVIGSNNQGKPAMAHRDIKSKNILVKDDGTCCIADLGLAVRKSTSKGLVDIPTGTRVGTSRYLAPEFLGDFYTVSCFDGYKRADIYSFGLVLWEMARRCVFEDVCEEYQLPYYDKVPVDPSVEEVYEVVCVEKYRPCCPDRWERHPTLKKVSKMMKECWKDNPQGRLTSARVSKSLKKYMDTVMEQDTVV